MSGSGKLGLLLLVLGLLGPMGASSVLALPWDTDMFRQESLKSNEVVRSPAKGTVPLGYQPFTLSIEEAEKKLSSPLPLSKAAVWAGRRFYNTQCLPCHGARGDAATKIGQTMGAPNLLTDLYRQRTDGRIFAVIFHGLRAMPRYGYKLSTEERWKVVNYLRFLQGADVPGMPISEISSEGGSK